MSNMQKNIQFDATEHAEVTKYSIIPIALACAYASVVLQGNHEEYVWYIISTNFVRMIQNHI